MNWSENAWQKILPIYERIIDMPFIKALMDGSLELEKFQFYIAQDSIYLKHYGNVLALIAAKAHETTDSSAFLSFAQNAIAVENSLHETYFKAFGVNNDGQAEPACHHYIHFLKSTAALYPVEVGMAAVLPCFWIYKAVGDYISQHQVKAHNPYQQWIATYSGEAFAEAVLKAISICDKVAGPTSEQTRADMTEAFITGSLLEFDFWDSAYKLRRWDLFSR